MFELISTFIVPAVIFLIAIALHQILFFVLRRTLKRGAWASSLNSLFKPFLFLFLEIAALVALDFIGLSSKVKDTVTHILIALIIITLGISVGALLGALYRHLYQKYSAEAFLDEAKGSLLTQIQILYRFCGFVIAFLVVACVLITFPNIRSLGLSLLGSAGVVGLAIGLAARPILLNLIAGVSIAFSKIVKLGDMVRLEREGELFRVEHIRLTHIVLTGWDKRRIFVPISDFIDKRLENLSTFPGQFVGAATLHCDFDAPLKAMRDHFMSLLQTSPLWNREFSKVEVTEIKEQVIQVRFSVSADSVVHALELKNEILERMLLFLQQYHPQAFFKLRQTNS